MAATDYFVNEQCGEEKECDQYAPAKAGASPGAMGRDAPAPNAQLPAAPPSSHRTPPLVVTPLPKPEAEPPHCRLLTQSTTVAASAPAL